MFRPCLRAIFTIRRASSTNKLSICVSKHLSTKRCQILVLVNKFDHLKTRAALGLNQYLQIRNCKTDQGQRTESDDDKNRKKPPLLMNFVPVMRPQLFLSLKNWILAKFIIQPYLDKDFTLKNFTSGAKQALGVVSSYLSQGDFQSLQGLITDDALSEIKKNFSALNVKERQDLLVRITDILFAFPYQIGIIFDDNSEKRFAEITVVYHCFNNFEDIKSQGKMLDENSKEDIKICNYRFIREYTKGVESDWTINRLGHFKVCHLED